MIKKYWIKIILLILVMIYPLGYYLPFEIVDSSLAFYYYLSGILVFPLLVVIAISYFFKGLPADKPIWIKFCASFFGLVLIAFIFLCSVSSMFSRWTSLVTFARNKKNPEIKVSEQRVDFGATGFGSVRTAKITPVLYFWNYIEEVDQAQLNPDEWDWVHEEP